MKHHSILSVETFTLEGYAFRDDEISRFGEYSTKRFALEAWERAGECAATGSGAQHSYQKGRFKP